MVLPTVHVQVIANCGGYTHSERGIYSGQCGTMCPADQALVARTGCVPTYFHSSPPAAPAAPSCPSTCPGPVIHMPGCPGGRVLPGPRFLHAPAPPLRNIVTLEPIKIFSTQLLAVLRAEHHQAPVFRVEMTLISPCPRSLNTSDLSINSSHNSNSNSNITCSALSGV